MYIFNVHIIIEYTSFLTSFFSKKINQEMKYIL